MGFKSLSHVLISMVFCKTANKCRACVGNYFKHYLSTDLFHHNWETVIQVYIPHYNDVRMGSMASQITSLTIVSLAVYSSVDQRKHQNSASLAFVRGILRGPVNSPHKWLVTRKMFPFDNVIMPLLDVTTKHTHHSTHINSDYDQN